MARWWRRLLRKKRRYALFGSGFLGIGVAILLIGMIDRELTPVLEAMATARVNYVVAKALDSAVAQRIGDENLDYSDLVQLQKDDEGAVLALSANMVALNELRTSLSSLAVDTVAHMDTGLLSIPVGNLTGISFFSGRGIEVPVEVVCAGESRVYFESQFTSAGINQTYHEIMLLAQVTVQILLPSEVVETIIEVEVPVAETVIVGKVPEAYFH